jgi:hypothetical protein
MNPIINRRIFFKIAATGVAGYFVSPMEAFSQTSATWSQNATILGTAKNVTFFNGASNSTRSTCALAHGRRKFRADHNQWR